MKTYNETKAEIQKLVMQHGVNGIYNYHIVALRDKGHDGVNIQNAINYFQFSPKAAKYR